MKSAVPDADLLAALSLDDKVRLLTGADNWSTCPLPAIGLRAMVVSDGPAGVRGVTMDDRGYDRAGTEPRFAFGHGLGYTTWSYESAAADAPALAPSLVPSLDGALGVTVVLRNTGRRTGREVVQAYVEPPAAEPGRPLRTLAAFTAVTAAPGEQVRARLLVPGRAFARYDEAAGGWVLPRRGVHRPDRPVVGRSPAAAAGHLPVIPGRTRPQSYSGPGYPTAESAFPAAQKQRKPIASTLTADLLPRRPVTSFSMPNGAGGQPRCRRRA